MENVHLFREIDNAKDDIVRAFDKAIDYIEELEKRVKDLEMELGSTQVLNEILQNEIEELKTK